MKFLAFILALFIAPIAHAEKSAIQVRDAYIYETKASMPAAAGFIAIKNYSDFDDKLVAFKTDAVKRTELHTMIHENEVMKMRKVDGYVVKGKGGVVRLDPMGNHIMLFGLKNDLNAGDKVKGALVFEKAGDVPVTFTVKKRGSQKKMNHDEHDHHDHHGHDH